MANPQYPQYPQYPQQPQQPQYQQAPQQPQYQQAPQQPQYQQAPQQPQYQQAPQQPQYQQAPPQYQQNVYQTNVYQNVQPVAQLKTDRNLAIFILLGIVTIGIYPLVVWCKLSSEINTVASRYDGKNTMHYLLAFAILGPITAFIYPLVWMHMYCDRVGNELRRRGINYSFSASDFWLWNVLGSCIIVGPFIFLAKLLKATNMINADYNMRG